MSIEVRQGEIGFFLLMSVAGWSGPSVDSYNLRVASRGFDGLVGAASEAIVAGKLDLCLLRMSGCAGLSFNVCRFTTSSRNAIASLVRLDGRDRRWQDC